MLAYIKHNRRRVVVWGIVILFMGLVSFFLPFIIGMKVPAHQIPQIAMPVMMAFLLFFVIPILAIPLRNRSELKLEGEMQSASTDIDDVIKELKMDDLLESLARFELDKKRLSIENERLKLDINMISLDCQREALSLVYTNPQSAMMIIWLWLKQGIQRLAKQRSLSNEEDTKMSLDEILDALEARGDIDYEMVASIKGMETFRNRVAFGETLEIDPEIAFSFMQQAFDISKNLTEKLAVAQE